MINIPKLSNCKGSVHAILGGYNGFYVTSSMNQRVLTELEDEHLNGQIAVYGGMPKTS